MSRPAFSAFPRPNAIGCFALLVALGACGGHTTGGGPNATGDTSTTADGALTDSLADSASPDLGSQEIHDGVAPGDGVGDTGSELDSSSTDAGCPLCDSSDDTGETAIGDTSDAGGGCEFPAKPLPGAPGSSCVTASDCDNGLCIANGAAKICTTTCSSCCPSGFGCELVANGSDSQFMCIPKLFTLCTPCNADADCTGASSKGALCVAYGSTGSFCGGSCAQTSDCPAGFACQDATGQSGAGKQCVKTSGECTCSAEAVTVGATTTCQQTNAFGTCGGLRKCTAGGLSACDAPLPATETCNGVDDNCDGLTDPMGAIGCTDWYLDQDNDGYGAGAPECLCGATGQYTATKAGDCNDFSAAINPGAFDSCNGIDDNCNGKTDEAYGDLDGDGIADCVDGDIDGDGWPNAEDCSPTNAKIYPGAPEICDGLDDNCDGITDGPGTPGCTPYYPDADDDGAGDMTATSTCLCAPAGLNTAVTPSDCNDNNAAIKPGAVEVCDGVDNDCNGLTDEGCDKDGDGWCDSAMIVVGQPPVCSGGTKDCNDANAAVNPGAQEICGNGIDDNCDGLTDIGLNAVGCTLYFDDADGDGYGAGSGACLCAPEGLVTAILSGDCDDTNSSIKPGAAEICGNGKDDNCNGLTDEAGGVGCTLWYADADSDGYGAGAGACLCAADSGHPVANNTDCNDAAAAISPAATETCNGVDDNCNGQTDEAGATGCSIFHADADGDGFGDPAKSACLCAANTGYPVANSGDCNDSVAAINPAATEICNGVDDNCDGATDEVNATGCQTYYADADNDTWGNTALSLCLCSPVTVFTSKKPGDCNDLNAAMYPGNPEVCDGVDNNCDGVIDEAGATGCKVLLRDHDGDGFGSATAPSECLCAPSGEYNATIGGDCNDSDNTVHPGAAEVCNGIDDDCDGATDPVNSKGCSAWYVDQDGDGFGTYLQNSLCLCKGIPGYASKGGDCNDTAAGVNPAAVDICNGIDDNCDGITDPKGAPGCKVYYADGDGDGYGVANLWECVCAPDGAYSALLAGDCNDAVAAISPAATETCNGIDDNCNGLTDENLKIILYVDGDGDGWGAGAGLALCQSDGVHTALKNGDCNDTQASVNPGATESCNGVDDNCNGQTDEGLPTTLWYKDLDGDGYGASPGVQLCGALNGYTVTIGGDCNDANQSISPAATESCNGIDDNCNGLTDEGAATGCTTFYLDADGDGVGVTGNTACLCAKSGQYTALVGGDCNDANALISPKAPEVCNGIDDNCDGLTDTPGANGCTTYYVDADGDNFGSPIAPTQCLCNKISGFATQAGDCNDNDAAVNPLATEVCNGKDDNCDGIIDPVNSGGCVTYYGDGDLDGYGGNLAQCACGPSGAFTALIGGDCNDQVYAINPGATEICNGIDDNCNGLVDEGLTKPFYVDSDGDGWGTGTPSMLCAANTTFSASKGGDCNDSVASINPGASETCNGIDDNCNGAIDEGLAFTMYYQDADSDGYGAAAMSKSACSQPAGYVANALDCNDTNAAIKPGAAEVCNGIDDNCNGQIDEGLATTTFYQDSDGDGFGNPSAPLARCSQPSGYVANALDCNDTNAAIHPGVSEVCNGIDDNCNGATDEGVQNTYYRDADGDGYGNVAVSTTACSQPTGYVSSSTDCNDSNAAIHPGATEVCNGIDDNCNGLVDDGLATVTYYQDADGDGYGNASTAVNRCSQPTGYVTSSTDCNDSSAAIHPGAAEVCNGVDDNCNGSVDEGNPGGGGNCTTGKVGVCAAGTVACSGGALVCNQNVAASAEVCNGLDDNCNGSVDEGNPGGGGSCSTGKLGVCAAGTVACSSATLVCNQNVTPSAEVCNGLDDNCNGSVDEGVLVTYYRDADGDGFGNVAITASACSAPTGYVANSTDCNDSNAAIHPGATEVCNGVDDHCNGTVDEGVLVTYYRDADGDGYGNAAVTTTACSAPTGYVANSTDCNDSSAAIHPGATEITCDGIDQDCNGSDLCPCNATLLNGLESSSGITTDSAQWSISNQPISPTQSSNGLEWTSLSYDGTYGYWSTVSGGENASFNITVPAGGLYVAADLVVNNMYNSSTVDNTLKVTLTLDGSAQVFGPYAVSQVGAVKTVKWPIAAARWGTALQFKANVYSNEDSYAAVGGVLVDNIRVVCN